MAEGGRVLDWPRVIGRLWTDCQMRGGGGGGEGRKINEHTFHTFDSLNVYQGENM